MKNGRAAGCIMVAGLMVVLAFGFAHASPVVTLELVEDPPFSVGGIFEIRVFADVGTLEIAAFGFDLIGFDGPSLTFNGASVAPKFKTKSLEFTNTDVAAISSPMDGIVTGNNVHLASLFFTVNHPGIFSVGIFSDLLDLNEGLFFPDATPTLDMSTTLDVNIAVPLPSAVLLLSSGLATLLFVRRKILDINLF